MPEGVASSGRHVAGGTRTSGRPPEPPPDDRRAPDGWTFDRKAKEWRPKRRPGRKVEPEPRGAAAVDEPQGWQAERDPEPARLGDDAKSPAAAEQLPVTREVKDDIAGAMGLVGLLVMPLAARADPHCGGALAHSWGQISEACIPLLSRSPRVVKWMTSGSGLNDWFGLALALTPVATAVFQHHVTRTVRIERDDDGQPVAVPEDFSGYPAA